MRGTRHRHHRRGDAGADPPRCRAAWRVELPPRRGERPAPAARAARLARRSRCQARGAESGGPYRSRSGGSSNLPASMSRKRRVAHRPALPRCVLDSGGVTALGGGSQRARAWLRWVIEHEGAIQVPTPVLVEPTTGDGARDAEVNRVLGILERVAAVLQAPDELVARRAGRLRWVAGSDDGIDALVAAAAVGDGSPAILLTSDPGDLERLLRRDPQVHVRKV